MKTLISTLMLLFAITTSAHASVINGVNLGNGELQLFGLTYFNTQQGAASNISQGIGSVSLIKNADGNTLWTSGNNGTELNFVFDDLAEGYLSDNGTIADYGTTGGIVKFFTQSIGSFQVTGNFADDSAAILGGNLFLDGTGLNDENGWTIEGKISPSNPDNDGVKQGNSGLGQLSLIAGAAYDNIIQDAILLNGSIFADMTFNFSTDNRSTAGYAYSGSVDFATNTISEPGILALFGLGLLGFIRQQRIS